jgi:CubicO group peptidase (beta-lactamase class C family)
LTHRAGFAPDDPLDLYSGTPDEIFVRDSTSSRSRPRRARRFVYSDVGYEVLGEVIRRVFRRALDRLRPRSASSAPSA